MRRGNGSRLGGVGKGREAHASNANMGVDTGMHPSNSERGATTAAMPNNKDIERLKTANRAAIPPTTRSRHRGIKEGTHTAGNDQQSYKN